MLKILTAVLTLIISQTVIPIARIDCISLVIDTIDLFAPTTASNRNTVVYTWFTVLSDIMSTSGMTIVPVDDSASCGMAGDKGTSGLTVQTKVHGSEHTLQR